MAPKPKTNTLKRKSIKGSSSPSTPPVKRARSRKSIVTEVPQFDTENKEPCSMLIMGDGDTGQLGLGPDIQEKTRAALVSTVSDILEVAVGGMHTVVLNKDNKIFTFGCNDEGALGRDTSVEGSETSPAPVDIPGKVVQISAGDSHTAAITDEGVLYVWGTFRDAHGSMGLLKNNIEKLPIKIDTALRFVKVASGAHHLVLLGVDGFVYSSGCGEQGQLGRLSLRAADRNGRRGLGPLLTPSMVPMPYYRKKYQTVNIWTGSYNTIIQNNKGEVYVFGLNNYSQLGLESSDDTPVFFHPTLSKSFSGKNWVKVSGGEHHTIALDDSGSVYVLGRKEYGRLGLGEKCSDAIIPTEVKIGDGLKCSDVSAGSFTSFAVTEDGKLFSWGMSSNMLGHGETDEDVVVPTLVKGKQLEGKKVLKIAAGGQHSAMLVKATDPTKK